jgi:hypothetical protein
MKSEPIGYVWRDNRLNLVEKYTQSNGSVFYRIYYKDKDGRDKTEETYNQPSLDMYVNW